MALKNFINEVRRSAILDVYDQVSFSHRSFAEFFVGFHIQRDTELPPEEQATSLYFDEIWSEVALYILGQRRELRQETLEAVFRHSDAKIDDLFLKLLSGRLLQAAWHSTEAVKEFGVEKALSYAPALRDALLRGTEKLRDQIPEILLDFVVLLASGDSFRSSFLQKSAKRLVDKLQSDAGEASIYQRLALLWTQREVLSNAERR